MTRGEPPVSRYTGAPWYSPIFSNRDGFTSVAEPWLNQRAFSNSTNNPLVPWVRAGILRPEVPTAGADTVRGVALTGGAGAGAGASTAGAGGGGAVWTANGMVNGGPAA